MTIQLANIHILGFNTDDSACKKGAGNLNSCWYSFLKSFFIFNRSDAPVVERLPHNRYVVGSSPGRVIPKTSNMVLTAFSSGARHMRMEWES